MLTEIKSVINYAEEHDLGYRMLEDNSILLSPSAEDGLLGPKVVLSIHTLPPLDQPVPGMGVKGYTLHRLDDGKVVKEQRLTNVLSDLGNLIRETI